MNAARSKQSLVVVAAALALFGVFGASFHQHAPILSDDDGNTDGCTICLFNRCASHGASYAAHVQNVEFDATSVVSVSDVVPDSLPARLKEARGPPVV